MEKSEFFSYSWHIDENETNQTVIRIYGLNSKNESVCVIVNNFLPYVYLTLPDNVEWDDSRAGLVASKLNGLLHDCKPVTYELTFKKRLYYANIDSKQKRRLYPYLRCCCCHTEDIRQLGFKIRKPINIPGLGTIDLKMHEHNASPILQLTSLQKLPTAGWITFLGRKIKEDDKISHCKYEYTVKWENLAEKQSASVARPLLMGYDIEVNSSIPSSMPKAHRPQDKIFQISCVFARQGCKPDTYERYLLTLGEPDTDILGDNIEVLMYETESDLLLGFVDLMQEKQPNICIGYNIFGFDIPYMIDRAKLHYCIYDFDRQGMTKIGHAKETTIEWSSSAYKNQSFQFLDAEGRIFVDLLPLIKRDYKMNNYQLKTIAAHFLKDMTKDPLDAKAIFKCYRLGMKGGAKGKKAMGVVGKYCVKDSELVIRLFETLTTWIALCEMSKVTNVPIFQLYTQGQQLKVFSQAYKKCTHENTVVEKDGYILKDQDHYVGATVFPPIPGVYDKVVPFDFSSLYPTTIIAYNISWDTLVNDDNIPDDICNVMEWDDHIGCLREGTLVTIGEFSLPIEKLANYRGKLLAVNETQKGLEYYSQTNFFDQGIKQCIELTFEDGTTLCCTPDHRILLENKTWTEAQNISIGSDRVSIGYKPPYYDVDGVSLIIGDFILEGARLVKFWKILGLLITDGHTTHNRTVIYYGHEIDGQNIIRDLDDIFPNSYSVCKQNYEWAITLLGKLGELFRNLDGVAWGNKKGIRTFPKILDTASISELKAFLSGLFGGDGHTFSFSEKAGTIGTVGLSWSSETEEELSHSFTKLQEYLQKCDIRSTLTRHKQDTLIHVLTEDTLKFSEEIGFSYCVHKSMRLEAGCSYLRLRSNVWEQQKWLIERVRELKTTRTIEDATDQAIKELYENNPIYNGHYSKPSKTQMIDLLRPSRKMKKPMFSKEYFPTSLDYLKNIGGDKFFDSYSVPRGESSIPCLYKKVIHKRNVGMRHVYDLEVDMSHSFVADGIVVHNCQHDPKEIRKAELNKLIKEKDSELKEMRKERDLKKNKDRKEEIKIEIAEFIKSTKPLRDERSQLNKSKPKHVICCHRKYRWLKKPMGVLPEILTHLLDTRKATKNEMKAVKGKMKEHKEGTDEHAELATYYDVLDQRQLALKVSANSGYGCMGVRRGYLPFMPGAMATTYMGRKAIEKAADSIQKDWKGVLVYGDSVTADTPVLIRYPNESINVQTIDTLGSEWIDYDQFKPNDEDRNCKEQSSVDAEIWTNGKWSKIIRVIRHKTSKKMYRILTHTGCVDVTEDHSMLRENGEKVKPEELSVGDNLLHSFPKEFIEFDAKIVEGTMKGLKCTKCKETRPLHEFYTEIYPTCKKCRQYSNHVKPYFSDFEYLNNPTELSREEAFVWGFFMADGSESGKHSWAINNQNIEYLNRAKMYLEKVEPNFTFKILENSQLVPVGKVRLIAEKYHQIMYDKNKNKIVPYAILNASREIKEWFFEGYYTGNGYKPDHGLIIPKNGSVRMDCKGKIGSQGLYLLLKSIGYENVSVNTRETEPNIFRINGSRGKPRKNTIAIRKILPLQETEYTEYVYDIETEEGIFHAGIGELIVKNTDSNYINFPHLQSAAECWDYSIKVAKEVSKLFPPPMSLAYEEKIYWRFFILTKKRYMSLACERDGVLDTKISKKGVLLQRRDNCAFVRKVYGDVVMMIFNKASRDDVLYYIITELNKLCGAGYPLSDFIVTKSVGDIGDLEPREGKDKNDKPCYKVGDYKVKLLPTDAKKREHQFKLKKCATEREYYLRCLPAQVQLAEKMRERGALVAAGSRLEYVITTMGGHTAKQYEKVEDSEYFSKHLGSLELDYFYYLKQLSNPLDQILDIIYTQDDGSGYIMEKGFMLRQYKYRLQVRGKMIAELKSIFAPKLKFDK